MNEVANVEENTKQNGHERKKRPDQVTCNLPHTCACAWRTNGDDGVWRSEQRKLTYGERRLVLGYIGDGDWDGDGTPDGERKGLGVSPQAQEIPTLVFLFLFFSSISYFQVSSSHSH